MCGHGPDHGAALFERDSYAFCFPPHNVAGHMVSVRRQDQGKMLRDSNWASHVEHCTGIRQIANHAIDRAAVELNRSGPQHAITRGRALVHGCSSSGTLKS
jgi:hypothetical protein